VKSWELTYLDDETMWPKSTMVELEAAHVDERGSIQSLANLPMKNASLITSRARTVRSNHYHRTDWHYMYVLSGRALYYFRPVGSNESPEILEMNEGDLVFTPPMEEHATLFLEDTTLLVLSRNPRDQANYEADVVRVTLLDPASVEAP
jgi:dTDP-4-dehydrorhamnose 3,5-epimerase-like enzyme